MTSSLAGDWWRNAVDKGSAQLRSTHWDGNGCGTNGTSACSRCYEPADCPTDMEPYEQTLAVFDLWPGQETKGSIYTLHDAATVGVADTKETNDE